MSDRVRRAVWCCVCISVIFQCGAPRSVFGAPVLCSQDGTTAETEQVTRWLTSHAIPLNPVQALTIAESLEEDNTMRKKIDESTLEEALDQLQALGPELPPAIVLWSDRWHPGVLGIVASRLMERFHRPTVLISADEDEGKGSGRSIPGFDVCQALQECREHLIGFGGHSYAAGLTIRAEQMSEFRNRLCAVVTSRLDPDDYVPKLAIDGPLLLEECNEALVNFLDRLSPFGIGNTEPLFVAENIQIAGARRMRADHGERFVSYVHPPAKKIGVLLKVKGGSPELPRELAMHVAYARPTYTNRSQVPADLVAVERRMEVRRQARLPQRAVLQRRQGLAVAGRREAWPADEERVVGRVVDGTQDEVLAIGELHIAPSGARGLNPAFDVTPADLVTAVVTERRVVRPAAGETPA